MAATPVTNKTSTSVSSSDLQNNPAQISSRPVPVLPDAAERPVYEVKSGDSLWRIADRNNITVNDLRKINNIRGSIIHPGQKLYLADMPVPVVEKEVTAPQEQALPVVQPVEEQKKAVPAIVPENELQAAEVPLKAGFEQISYTIKKGDNLWKIARNLYCTEKEIMRLNGMKNDIIHEGRTLKIVPGTTTDSKYDPEKIAYSYLVTPKDLSYEEPLSVIAERFSGSESHQVITAADIKEVNDLEDSPLHVGQHLWIANVTIEGRSASWYGSDFHGKKMANGNNYDMNALSCATRDLPLGSRVSVMNSANGREVENVPVWDRGPYVDKANRAIDVSREVAKWLGMFETGVAPVRITIKSLPKLPDLPLQA